MCYLVLLVYCFLAFNCMLFSCLSVSSSYSCQLLCCVVLSIFMLSCLLLSFVYSFLVFQCIVFLSIIVYSSLLLSCLFLSIYLFIISSSSPTILEYLKTSVCSALASLLKNLDRNNNYLKTFFHRYFSPFVLKIFQSVCIKYISVSLY